MAIELRYVDMREVYPNVNVIAPAPRGETVYKVPVTFEPLSPIAPRLDIGLEDIEGKVALTVRYGSRRLPLVFAR